MKDSILETTRRALGAKRLQEQDDALATWRGNQKKVLDAAKRYKDPGESTKVLVIQGSDRNEATCPGEKPKSMRLAEHAVKVLKRQGVTPHLLDLSRITSEKGKMIWPCKACFSTSAALCHWPCVAEGQRVNSSMFTPIEKVQSGDMISTGRVTRAWRTRDSATIYEVRVSDGRRVRLTSNHRIKVHQPRVRVKEAGQWVYKYPEQWKAVEDLREGDLIPFQLGGNFGPPLIGVQEKMYLLAGLIWGDGTTVGKPSCRSFNLYVPTVEKQLIAQLQAMYPESKLKHRVKDQMSYLTVPRVYAQSLIETLGLDKSAPVEERSIPEPIMQGSETAARAFLRGWFTADGCVETNRNRVSLSSRSLPALRDAQLLLAKMGIKSCITYCDHLIQEVRGKEFPRASSLNIQLWDSIQTFKYKVGFIHPEKTQKLISLKAPKRNFRVKEGKVTEVLRVGRAPVYDVEIAESHEFVVEGVLVHNCTCYPDAALNQSPDWMQDEIYSRLVESHGLMVICPVYWYSPPSVLKLMLDRMVCMDGANPDPQDHDGRRRQSCEGHQESQSVGTWPPGPVERASGSTGGARSWPAGFTACTSMGTRMERIWWKLRSARHWSGLVTSWLGLMLGRAATSDTTSPMPTATAILIKRRKLGTQSKGRPRPLLPASKRLVNWGCLCQRCHPTRR